MKNKVHTMSAKTAILLMVICILLGITLGNRNALHQAIAKAEQGFADVSLLTDRRVEKAHGLLTLLNRYNPDSDATKALSGAIDRAKKAKNPEAILTADQEIAEISQVALNELPSSMAYAVDETLANGLKDELSTVDRQIARMKRTYNEGFQEAIDVYQKLPTKWLFKNPEEGLI